MRAGGFLSCRPPQGKLELVALSAHPAVSSPFPLCLLVLLCGLLSSLDLHTFAFGKLCLSFLCLLPGVRWPWQGICVQLSVYSLWPLWF